MNTVQSHDISGDEKSLYLRTLDRGLGILSASLSSQGALINPGRIEEFGKQHNWDFSRLREESLTYGVLGWFVDRVRQEYRWFDTQIYPKEPLKNMGYFQNIGVSAISGFPWLYDFITLSGLKKNADAELAALPDYPSIAASIAEVVLSDTTPTDKVPAKVGDVASGSLKRNFLEALKGTQLLGWGFGEYSMDPVAKKVTSLGVEELWNIIFANYIPGSSVFEVYDIDCWQDKTDTPLMSEAGVDPELKQALHYGADNAAWYILQSLDDRFEILHPMHASRGILKAYESRYVTHPDAKVLPATKDILARDKTFGLLRFERQYSFAPNRKLVGKRIKQEIYQEDWRDEIIVSPANFSTRVAKSLKGSQIRIYEM